MAVSGRGSLSLRKLLDFAFGWEHLEEGRMLRICSLNSGRAGGGGVLLFLPLSLLMAFHKHLIAPASPPSVRLVSDPVMVMVGMEADFGLVVLARLAVLDRLSLISLLWIVGTRIGVSGVLSLPVRDG